MSYRPQAKPVRARVGEHVQGIRDEAHGIAYESVGQLEGEGGEIEGEHYCERPSLPAAYVVEDFAAASARAGILGRVHVYFA
jgi:hypothetical protein